MKRYAWLALVMLAACNSMCEPSTFHSVACANACQLNGVKSISFTECVCNPPKPSGEAPAAPKGNSP